MQVALLDDFGGVHCARSSACDCIASPNASGRDDDRIRSDAAPKTQVRMGMRCLEEEGEGFRSATIPSQARNIVNGRRLQFIRDRCCGLSLLTPLRRSGYGD